MQTLETHDTHIAEHRYAEAGKKINVMIVDTHTLMREALYRVVSTFPQAQICANLSSLEDVILVAQQAHAQVIILSSSIPVSVCLDLIKLITEGQPSVGIIVIQRCLSPETTMTFIKLGIQSVLGEEASEEDLAKAITAAAMGNTFLDRGVRKLLGCSVSRASVHLTIREIEVLSLLKRGKSNFSIAHTLGMKEKTLEKHLTHIYEKLHVNSRTEATLKALHLHI